MVGSNPTRPTDYSAQDSTRLNLLNKITQYSIGVPRYFIYGRWSLDVQYTNLNVNPWIAFSGAWDSINNSGILDNVVSYRDGPTSQGFTTFELESATAGTFHKPIHTLAYN